MADTKTYTVTKRAGTRVAGRQVQVGQELQLTEEQARAELLAGAIVEGGKDDQAGKAKGGKDAADPFAGSEKLDDIRARARGLEKAPEPAAADAKSGAKTTSNAAAKDPAGTPAGGQDPADAGAGT